MREPALLPPPLVEWYAQQVQVVVGSSSTGEGPPLIFGASWQVRSQILAVAAERLGYYYLALGWPLAQALHGLPEQRRRLRLEEILYTLLTPPRGQRWQGCAVDRIEALFLPNLQVNVFGLLQRMGRNQPLLVAWPGHYSQGRLSYAPPGHPEHQSVRVGPLPAIHIEEPV